jgi:hypothetical protein
VKIDRCLLGIAAFGTLALAGCASTPAARIRSDPRAFGRLTPAEQTMVRSGGIEVGFDMSAVKLALGRPDKVVPSTSGGARAEDWIYDEDGVHALNARVVIEFHGGKVIRIVRIKSPNAAVLRLRRKRLAWRG